MIYKFKSQAAADRVLQRHRTALFIDLLRNSAQAGRDAVCDV